METFSASLGPLWGEYAGHWWIPLTKASDADVFFDLYLNRRRDAGDLRLHHDHYDVTAMGV